MSGMAGLAEKIGALAARVQESADSVDFMFGQVVSEKPLSISVEQRLVLPEDILILSGAVVDLVTYEDEESGEKVTVPRHNLASGENVLLARVMSGDAYVVLARCYPMEVE